MFPQTPEKETALTLASQQTNAQCPSGLPRWSLPAAYLHPLIQLLMAPAASTDPPLADLRTVEGQAVLKVKARTGLVVHHRHSHNRMEIAETGNMKPGDALDREPLFNTPVSFTNSLNAYPTAAL